MRSMGPPTLICSTRRHRGRACLSNNYQHTHFMATKKENERKKERIFLKPLTLEFDSFDLAARLAYANRQQPLEQPKPFKARQQFTLPLPSRFVYTHSSHRPPFHLRTRRTSPYPRPISHI